MSASLHIDARRDDRPHETISVLTDAHRAQLLADIEQAAAAPSDDAAELVMHAIFLLAEVGETRAFAPTCRLLAAPNVEGLEGQFGYAVTEVMAGVLVRLFDGDEELLVSAVLSSAGNDYSRSAMMGTLAMLAHEGRIEKPVVEHMLARLPEAEPDMEKVALWINWMHAIAALGLHELAPLVERTIGAVDEPEAAEALEAFREELARSARTPGWMFAADSKTFTRFTTAAAAQDRVEKVTEVLDQLGGALAQIFAERRMLNSEMSPRRRIDAGRARSAPAFEPSFILSRKVGRNEPCPCGSGKKYKKCCLD